MTTARFESWRSAATGTAVTTSVAATWLVGAAVLTIAYRVFQGPGTNQLFIISAWATVWFVILGSPVAIPLGAIVGRIAVRLGGRGRVRWAFVVGCGASYAIVYSGCGWLAARWRWGSWFELNRHLVAITLVTGVLTGLLVGWRVSGRAGDVPHGRTPPVP